MARLRDDYDGFVSRKVEILAIGPNDKRSFQRYWKNERLPFPGLADPDHVVATTYHQEVNLFKYGRMPLVCIVGLNGRIRYVHYGTSMSDIPSNETLLKVIDELIEES